MLSGINNIMKIITTFTRDDFRKWLMKNHNKENKISVILYKKHTNKFAPSHRELMEEAICFGWIDTTIKRLDEDKYIRNFSKRNNNSKWSDNTLRYAKDLIKQTRLKAEQLELVNKHMSEANTCLNQSQFSQAIEIYKKILKIDAKHEQALSGMDRAEKALGQREKLTTLLAEGKSYLRDKKYNDALSSFKAALELDTVNREVIDLVNQCELKLKELQQIDNLLNEGKKLFEKSGDFDKKNKLNRSKKLVPLDLIESIEKKGITIEQLEELKFPVFKYKTQITIHGQFPDLSENRIFGYKSVFQNKNNSVGIRYIAIDAEKKRFLSKVFSTYNRKHEKSFSFYQDSTGTFIQLFKQTTPENFIEMKRIFKELPSCYFGNSDFARYTSFLGDFLGIKIYGNSFRVF